MSRTLAVLSGIMRLKVTEELRENIGRELFAFGVGVTVVGLSGLWLLRMRAPR